MNESEENPAERAAPVEGDEAPAKPARRKRTPKAAAETAAPESAVAPAEATAEAPSDEAAAPKPARKRRTTKAAAADVAPSESAAAPQEAATESASVSAPSAVPVPEPAPAAVPEARKFAVDARSADAGDTPEGSEDDGESDGAPGEAGASGSSRNRNRRRNRKERQRERAAAENAATGNGSNPSASVVAPDAGEVFAHVMSPDFDVEEPAAESDTTAEAADGESLEDAAHKRVLQPDPDAPKLHKVLAQAGVGSRRDMEDLILEGKITVNDQPAHVGQRISFGDQIKVDGKPVKVRIVPPPPRILAYHKPVGEVVTHDDPQNRPTVFRRLPRLQQGKWQSVGRLDLNTEGLLLFTNSGDLANQLMHPRFGVEREYAVRVLGTLDEGQKANLLEGVEVEGQRASFKSIVDGGGEGANHWYRVVITEGRNREVRKLFDAVDLTVSRLIRIRYGTVVLPRGLKRGVWVDLADDDVKAIRRLAGGSQGQGQPQQRGDRTRGPGQPGQGQGGPGQGKQQQPRNDRQQGGRNDRNAKSNRGPDQHRPPAPRDDFTREFRPDDDDDDLDFDPSKIPNPLEQTFDKRFVQKPRGAVGGAGFRSGGGGFGAGGSAPVRPKKGGGGPREPDPLQTSVGYIGGDAFHRRGGKGGGGGGGKGGNRGGGGGYGGGGGGGGGGFGKGGGGRRGR